MAVADTLGTDLIHRGQGGDIHLSCKDWNRNALESRAGTLLGRVPQCARAVGTTRSPGPGTAAPVFDIDSVGLLRMFTDMNEGIAEDPLGTSDFLLGCVVTNHSAFEREVIPQYRQAPEEDRERRPFSSSPDRLTTHARTTSCSAGWRSNGLHVPVSPTSTS